MLTAIALGTAGALLGFFLGVRSKAVARRKSIEKEKKHVESLSTIVNRKAPPPPPLHSTGYSGTSGVSEYRSMSPSLFSSYDKNTFANTSICKNCNTVAHYADMWTHNPCPNCGGKVRNHVPCKWMHRNGKMQWVKSEAR